MDRKLTQVTPVTPTRNSYSDKMALAIVVLSILLYLIGDPKDPTRRK